MATFRLKDWSVQVALLAASCGATVTDIEEDVRAEDLPFGFRMRRKGRVLNGSA
jgi:hypothetical protein